MKKILLILILLLTFTLTGYSADLFGTYDQRIKFTIDHTKIDTELTWIPIATFFTAAQAEEIFAEFDADEDFDRGAFTKADEVTQLYADCELFDDSESLGNYKVSRDGWVISNSAGTDYYFYYDNDAGHNTTYISKSGGTAAQSVYDGDTKVAYSMADGADTSHIYDSTSNNNDGTKDSANNPVEAVGQIGLAQDFSSDAITKTDEASLDISPNITISAWIKADTLTATTYFPIVSKDASGVNRNYALSCYGLTVHFGYKDNVGYNNWYTGNELSTGTFYHVAATLDNTNVIFYVNGVAVSTQGAAGVPLTGVSPLRLGTFLDGSDEFDGIIDEVQISAVTRTAGWMKAEFNSGNDSLLTYGAEETEPVGGITWNSIVITKWNGITITTPLNTQ